MIRGATSLKVWAAPFLGAVAAAMVAALVLTSGPASATATFVVNSTGDQPDFSTADGACDTTDGGLSPCTLRAAIQQANATAEADTIAFQIGGPFASGVKTIKPSAFLPTIDQPLTIDGYTQPGSSPNTNATGAINATPLVELDGTNAGLTCGLTINAPSVVVRGLVINRFEVCGISVVNVGSSAIEGNFIGTNAAGDGDLGNEIDGVRLSSGDGNTVGGDTPAARNLISGNGPRLSTGASGTGVSIHSSNNKVQGNLIGTSKGGTTPLANFERGVLILHPASKNTIGGDGLDGDDAAEANVIAFNGQDGVLVGQRASDTSVTGNRILGNSIFSNVQEGIDLNGGGFSGDPDGDGPTPNDRKDPDTGPNNLQNTPVLSSAGTSGGKTTVTGKLKSRPGKNFTIQFFSSDVADPSGKGEGKTFLGKKTVKTSDKGVVSFSFTKTLPAGENVITATATNNKTGDTSEFSRAVTAS